MPTTITLTNGLTSTTPAVDGTSVSYDTLRSPTINTGDITVTIDQVTSNSTNQPTVDPEGVVTLELTDDEAVVGAVVSFRSQSGLWRAVDFYLHESGDDNQNFGELISALSNQINLQLSSLEVTRNVFRQPVFERLDLVRGDRYNGVDAAKLTWSTGDRRYSNTPVKLLVFDGEQLLAEGSGVADGDQITIDDFEAEFDADLFRGHPRSAKLRYAVVAGTKETLRVGRCHVFQRPDLD